jgi:uncharacterized membrane protein
MAEENSLLSFERVVFFSDAVFAIVITLLVLEIKVPHLTNWNEATLNDALVHLLPKFFGFICSFFIVGLMWFEHHRIFRYIERFDSGLIWRNLVFLLFISFIPFPTALFSEYVFSKVAFLMYVAVFGMAALSKLWIWNHAVKNDLVNSDADPQIEQRIARRSLAVPLSCLVCIGLGFFLPNFLAFLGFPLIPVFAYLLDPTKRAKMVSAE